MLLFLELFVLVLIVWFLYWGALDYIFDMIEDVLKKYRRYRRTKHNHPKRK